MVNGKRFRPNENRIERRDDILISGSQGMCPVTQSERKFQRELHEPWRSSFDCVAEQGAREVSGHRRRPKKLRVIEHIESFQPELQGL